MKTIEPKTLKGFRDFLPSDMRIRQQVFAIFRKTFERYGYEPLETPTLEYAEILLGKYGEEAEQLIYHFKDRGDRHVAMRYDVTVPACRVLAQHFDKLSLPFKRYQIQPVWRAENTQKGRFREFYQCDADTFGSSSLLPDAEFVQLGLEALSELGFNNVVARINNRKFIDGLTQYAGASADQFYNICIAIDKLEKIGAEGVQEEMRKRGIPQEMINKLFEIISIKEDNNDKLIATLKGKMTGIATAQEGLDELKSMFGFLQAVGVNTQNYIFDLGIIRGLSYYTGPVWEFVVRDGGVGSVGGAGRYDKLVGLYLGKDIPATGGSFGIERIIEIIKDRQMLSDKKNTQVLVTVFSPELATNSVQAAAELRKQGINTELYPDDKAKMEKQLKYANRKEIPYVLILGPEESEKGVVKVRDMGRGEEKSVQPAKIISLLDQV